MDALYSIKDLLKYKKIYNIKYFYIFEVVMRYKNRLYFIHFI